MGTIDPEQERKRLTELYSGMADGELEELAIDFASLTDVARRTLKEEMVRRGLAFALPDSMLVTDDRKPVALEPVFGTNDWSEASVVKGLLQSNGIEVTTEPSSGVALYVEVGFAGSIVLLVRAEEADETRRLIEESEQQALKSEE
jgi:hypothetical protein